MKDILTLIFVIIGLVSAFVGVLGLFRFKFFYLRILVSANVDTVGMLFMMIGALISSPNITIALKIVVIIVLSMITTPLSSHATVRSAYASGLRIHK